MLRKFAGLFIMGMALALAASVPKAIAQTEEVTPKGVKLGYLSCHVSSGFGIIVGSSRDLACTFTSSNGKSIEHYNGEINKFGADIGYLQSGVILWEVLAPENTTAPGSLSGHYAGGTASATLGVGVGVHALAGGMHGAIALQPIAIEGNTGLNVAAGVATMNLEYELGK